MKETLQWHQDCLRNNERTLQEHKDALKRTTETLTQSIVDITKEIEFRKCQIAEAKKRGMTGFDSERFLIPRFPK